MRLLTGVTLAYFRRIVRRASADTQDRLWSSGLAAKVSAHVGGLALNEERTKIDHDTWRCIGIIEDFTECL